jgi:mevalonate kinase
VKLPNDIKIFLIDTGLPATTGDLVPIFQNKLHNPSLKSEIVKMAALTDQIIEAFITNTTSFAMIDELTFHQQTVLKEMFLINKSLQEALNQFNGSLSIKLCGSGGGGFLLGFAKSENYEEITKYFIEKRISIITIEF